MPSKKQNFFTIQAPETFKLSTIPTLSKSLYSSEDTYQELLLENQKAIEEFQNQLYASQKQGLIIVFQGMDSSGKDGAIKHVMSGVNPQGCSVASFKTPTQTEIQHDFLWRSNLSLPARGEIKIFNRSYYEEVLITKVHPKLLELEKVQFKNQRKKQFWEKRYQDISHFEHYLHRQGYEIVKIFIHISRLEQKKRLLARFTDPKKHWKISIGDIHERKFWKQYQSAYEECIAATSSTSSPWYIVPGDDKKNARLAISQILTDRLKAMQLSYPKLNSGELKKLKKMQRLLR